jgi:hypothetical protein
MNEWMKSERMNEWMHTYLRLSLLLQFLRRRPLIDVIFITQRVAVSLSVVNHLIVMYTVIVSDQQVAVDRVLSVVVVVVVVVLLILFRKQNHIHTTASRIGLTTQTDYDVSSASYNHVCECMLPRTVYTNCFRVTESCSCIVFINGLKKSFFNRDRRCSSFFAFLRSSYTVLPRIVAFNTMGWHQHTMALLGMVLR